MSQTHDEVRALRVMVEVLRAEPTPELPWDAIEQRLFSKLGAQPVRASEDESAHPEDATSSAWGRGPLRDQRSSSTGRAFRRNTGERPTTFTRVLGFAAVAAALALGVSSLAGSGEMPAAITLPPHRVDGAAVAFAPGSTRVHDLSALHPGDVVEAGDAPLRFGQAGLATWALAPGSVARVHTTGVGHTVTLERGAIRAEVTPRDFSEGLVEAFAVEVEGTRVAVHGTAFSVKIEGGRAIVDVEHGAVAVGPVGNTGATTGHLLVGPSRASFSLDGGRSAWLLDRTSGALVASDVEDVATEPSAPSMVVAAHGTQLPPAPVAIVDAPAAHDVDRTAAAQAPRLHAAHSPTDDKAAAHPVAAPPAAAEAPAEPPRLSIATAQARLNRCFRRTWEKNHATESGVSIVSTFHVEVRDDGSVKRAQFNPPLEPTLQGCAVEILSGRFPDGAGNLDIPVSFQP